MSARCHVLKLDPRSETMSTWERTRAQSLQRGRHAQRVFIACAPPLGAGANCRLRIRVASLIVEASQRVVEDEFPRGPQIQIVTPDERQKRHGQAIAAVSPSFPTSAE